MADETHSSGIKLPTFKELKMKTVGETYQHLNRLIKGKSLKDFQNLNELVSIEISLPLFEDSMRLILIDSLHLEDEVVKILLSQNEYQIKRILKCKWFFSKPLSSEFWSKQIFPCVSITTRWNVITSLSKYWNCNEEEAEKLFTFLYNEYGGHFGEPLLHLCSKKFIQNHIKNIKTPFYYNKSCRALLKITKRYPELGMEVLNIMCKSVVHYEILKYKKVIIFVACHHPELLIPFVEKHHQHIQNLNLGRNVSRRFGPKAKIQIFTIPNLVKSSFINHKELFKVLNFEEKIKFIEAVVRFNKKKLSFDSWENEDANISCLVKNLEPNKRLLFIETVFKKLYNSDFKDNPKLWSADILELFPTSQRIYFVETIEKLLKEAQENDLDLSYRFSLDEPETFVCLYDFDVGFEKLKKINSKVPNVNRRESILRHMVKNCRLNKTPQRIQEVINFVMERHRQDDPKILYEFQKDILKILPSKGLKLDMLEKLEEVAHLWILKGYPNNYSEIAEKLIICRLDEKLEVGQYMKKFLNCSLIDFNFNYFIHNFKSKHAKNLFFAYCEGILQWFQSNPVPDDKKESLMFSIMHTCKKYNKNNKNHPIRLSEIPNIKKELRNLLVKHYEHIGGQHWPLDIFDHYYNRLLYFYKKTLLFKFILKKHPDIFFKIFDKIITKNLEFFDFEPFFVEIIKTLSFYEMTNKLKTQFLKVFKGLVKEDFNKRVALKYYSHICNIEEFSEMIADYVPREDKSSDDKSSEILQIQLAASGMIKNIKPRWKNFDLILKFFFGDFLRVVIPSYYSCSYNTRVDVVLPFLIDHYNRIPSRISLKKDLIRLICDLSSRKEKIEFFQRCWDENPHHSIRIILLSSLNKIFVDQPTKEAFKVVKKFVIESNELVIAARPELNRIPDEYLNEYVNCLWDYSEKLPKKSKNNFRNSILSHFGADKILLLSEEFCEKLIKENLFNNSSLDIDTFTINYILSRSEKINFVLEFLKISNTKFVAGFLKNLLKSSINDIPLYSDVLNCFFQNWPNSLKISLYEDRLMFQYYLMISGILKNFEPLEKNKEKISVEFGKELRKLFLSFDNLTDIVVILVDSVSKVLSNLSNYGPKVDPLYVVKELLEFPFNKSLIVIILSAMPENLIQLYSCDESLLDAFEKKRKQTLTNVIQSLKNCNDQVINIYLTRKFDI